MVCPDCWVELVDDADAIVRCRHCERDWPARMHSCPHCLAELRPPPVAEAMAAVLAAGGHLRRPAGVAPFASGPECVLLRLAPRGRLVLSGSDGLVEASLVGADIGAVPPLTCEDFDGGPLFRVARYAAADRAVVVVGANGAALATVLSNAGGLDVRDETSAPVARLTRERFGEWALFETGGQRLATVTVVDHDQEGWVDDEWSVRDVRGRIPLRPLGVPGVVVAAKVLLGRAWPEPREAEVHQQ